LLDGYYIYYEKNEEMQNYMVENKEEDIREETSYDDHAIKKIRSIIKDKKEVKDDRNVIRLLYAASSLLAIIVLVIAATMLDNYDKMRSMESALNTISESLSVVNNEDPSSDETQETMSHGTESTTTKPESDKEDSAENLQSDDSDKLNVETVPGDIKEDEADDNSAEDSEENDKEDNSQKEDSANDDKETTEDTKKQDDKEDTTKSSNEKETVKTDAPIRYYTVEAGDSLAGISYKLYETYKYMDKIKELNGIEDEDMVYAGQKLIVP
jgi:LysM repeat protein